MRLSGGLEAKKTSSLRYSARASITYSPQCLRVIHPPAMSGEDNPPGSPN